MTASTTRTVLITSATGVQGRAVIDALLSRPTTPSSFHVLALTRDLRSTGAMNLALQYPEGLTLVKADLASPESVRNIFVNEKTMTGQPVWGIYLVAPCALASNAKEEERQGKVIAYLRTVPYYSHRLIAGPFLRRQMVVDLAREIGVSIFIYSSSQLVQNSFDDPNYQSQFFAGKLAVERYIQSLDERSLSWIILRPAFSMEGFTGKPGPFVAGVFAAGLKPETKVHLTVAEDIGRAAAELFLNSGPYLHRAVPLVSDSLTMPEIYEAYKRVTDYDLPTTYAFVSNAVLTFICPIRHFVEGIKRMDQASSPLPSKLPISTTSFETWAASLK